MPLPLIVGAAIAGAVGVGSGIHGAAKMKEANDTIKNTERRHRENLEKYERKSEETNRDMDALGKLELDILNSFKDFSDTIEKIQNRPKFNGYTKNGVTLPKCDKETLKNVSVGAGVLLGGLGGAAAGTAGGFAAAGMTTSVVMALGSASTGTAISSLSGAAAVNATLAALGGGSLAAGGGGMALGATVLNAATLGVGLMVGGIIFNVVGSGLSNKADEAYQQMKKAEDSINSICYFLGALGITAQEYTKSLTMVRKKYKETFERVSYTVNVLHKTEWSNFTNEEEIATQNAILLVQLLYNMCKVNLVKKSEHVEGINTVNFKGINESTQMSQMVLNDIEGKSDIFISNQNSSYSYAKEKKDDTKDVNEYRSYGKGTIRYTEKLVEQADKFIHQTDAYRKHKERYNELLKDLAEYIGELENRKYGSAELDNLKQRYQTLCVKKLCL